MDRLSTLSALQRRILATVFCLLTAVVSATSLYDAATEYLMDLEVFQDAGWAIRRGDDLYSDEFPTRSGFRFIYPPFAALIFFFLTWLKAVPLQVVWTGITIGAAWAVLVMVSAKLKLPRPMLIATCLLGPVLLLAPIRDNLGFGQINVILALLIVADLFGYVPKRLKGMGIGVAAGIKITPAAYALVFLMRKDYAGVVKSCLWFSFTVVLGFIARFEESKYFWSDEFLKTNRGGSYSTEANQALSGLIARAGVDYDVVQLIVPMFLLLSAILAALIVRDLEKTSQSVLSAAVVALFVCLSSPISVNHHWSILMLFLPTVLALRDKSLIISIIVLIGAFYWAPWIVFKDLPSQIATSPALWLYGNMQGITALILYVLITAQWITERQRTKSKKQISS
ncbi:glycosyltransferase 87 family protein [Corynebacterium sp. HMSC063G05]|uniref:glycosyltransferase 87 family protein n=1 Tax=Corynebacterium sp. HMSC063G05 TaxID=1739255 RepID=UPI000B2F779D|nr:glycosyltransferase 87 family protein [Corynebacterium sp. HMSC063G05]